MAEREIVEREVVHDGPGRSSSGLIIGAIVALVLVVVLLFAFLGGDDADDGGDGGGVEVPEEVDVNIDGGTGEDGG